MKKTKQKGFSIIELVIALFVASGFIISGYLLYSLVMKEAFEARNKAIASQLAYQELNKLKTTLAGNCTAKTSSTSSSQRLLGDLNMTKTIDCPLSLSDTPNVSKITVTIEYGPDSKKITQASYATGI